APAPAHWFRDRRPRLESGQTHHCASPANLADFDREHGVPAPPGRWKSTDAPAIGSQAPVAVHPPAQHRSAASPALHAPPKSPHYCPEWTCLSLHSPNHSNDALLSPLLNLIPYGTTAKPAAMAPKLVCKHLYYKNVASCHCRLTTAIASFRATLD